MRRNHAKAALQAGRSVLGTLCTTSSTLMAEALGHAGYDFVVVDLQHGENEMSDLVGMLQAISATPAVPMVRVPANAPVWIQRALDLGAYGVVVPMVESREDAEAVVDSVRYAPAGRRSWGPVRGTLYGGPDYFSRAHEEILVMPMLETAEGMRRATQILAVEGIDGCFVGPNDLSISLGHASELATLPPDVEDGIAAIVEATRTTGRIAGVQAFGIEQARARLAQGFRFVSVLSDLRMARLAATEAIRALRV